MPKANTEQAYSSRSSSRVYSKNGERMTRWAKLNTHATHCKQ